MPRPLPAPLLRERLLDGVAIVLARPTDGSKGLTDSFAAAVRTRCRSLGARVSDCELALDSSPEAEEVAAQNAVEEALAELGAIDMLVLDGAALFASRRVAASDSVRPAGSQDAGALVGALEACWNITRAVAQRAFLERGHPGRVVYLAPAPDAGAHALAACAGLENLSRTLSIEWARHAVTPVTIAPGTDTSAAEVAELTAYLASSAGAYFSGCLLDLRGPAAR